MSLISREGDICATLGGGVGGGSGVVYRHTPGEWAWLCTARGKEEPQEAGMAGVGGQMGHRERQRGKQQ